MCRFFDMFSYAIMDRRGTGDLYMTLIEQIALAGTDTGRSVVLPAIPIAVGTLLVHADAA